MTIEDDIAFFERVPTLNMLGRPALRILAIGAESRYVHQGEVLALLGDNGAGKSTLIKCVSGAHRLDAGAISVDGVDVTIHSPADARELGIETVYQDLALFDNLGPVDNFYAGRELAGPGWLPVAARRPALRCFAR